MMRFMRSLEMSMWRSSEAGSTVECFRKRRAVSERFTLRSPRNNTPVNFAVSIAVIEGKYEGSLISNQII